MSVKQMTLVWELDLEPNKKIVLLAYADHADDEGDNVFPSLGRVAHKTGYSVDQVRRISRELRSAGLMELVSKGVGRGNPHRYRLTLQKGGKLQPFQPKEKGSKVQAFQEEKGGISSPKKVASEPQKGGIAMPPEPSYSNRQHEPSYSRRDAGASPEEPKEQEKNWFTLFCNEAGKVGLLVTPEDRQKVPKNLKDLPEKHQATDTEMHRVLLGMIDARLRNYSMSPQEALNKVRGIPNGRQLAAVGNSHTPTAPLPPELAQYDSAVKKVGGAS